MLSLGCVSNEMMAQVFIQNLKPYQTFFVRIGRQGNCIELCPVFGICLWFETVASCHIACLCAVVWADDTWLQEHAGATLNQEEGDSEKPVSEDQTQVSSWLLHTPEFRGVLRGMLF